MTNWEKFFDEKIREIARGKTVFDIGSGVRFQKELAPYEKYFLNSVYKTIDINEKSRPDIVADAGNLPIPDNAADSVICKAVLQHVENPFQVAGEIRRILKPGGKCFVYIPFIYPYHGSKEIKDYWRFSEDGVRRLFREFSSMEICPIRGHFETIANFFPLNAFAYPARFLDLVFGKMQSRKQVSGFYAFLVK